MKLIFDLAVGVSYITLFLGVQPYPIYMVIGVLYLLKAGITLKQRNRQ